MLGGDVKRVVAVVSGAGSAPGSKSVEENVTAYRDLFHEEKGGSKEKRQENYVGMVDKFYNLVTDFYEFGWGQSFHFAPRKNWETFETSIYRHEMFMAHHIGLGPGKKVLDVGCGVGGPARMMVAFSDCNVVGINNNAYQGTRFKLHTDRAHMSSKLAFQKGDFMHMPFEDNSFDCAYSIEATCHAPDLAGVYGQIIRVLKPGGMYASYEWVMTAKYNPTDPEHVRIKKGIEEGNGLPELQLPEDVHNALEEAGFEVMYSEDRAYNSDPETPWYLPLSGNFSFAGFKHTRLGRYLTNRMCAVLETIKIAPAGTTEVSNLLMMTANDLVDGGKKEIFTPMYFVVARKPLE